MKTPTPESMVGEEVAYTRDTRDGQRRIVGVIDQYKYAELIEDINTGERWRGVKFRIKPSDGGRAEWTGAMPDKSSPLPPRDK